MGIGRLRELGRRCQYSEMRYPIVNLCLRVATGPAALSGRRAPSEAPRAASAGAGGTEMMESESRVFVASAHVVKSAC